MSGCYEGWTLDWREWVLVGTGPDGQRASLGEVWTDNTGAHYELLDPMGGDRFHTAKAANRATAQRIATNLARRVGATFLPSDASQASEPVSHTGSVARPTDVAAQPEAGAFGGEASPGASAPQAGPPSARELETVGAEPAPVTGSSHAPLPAGDAPSPAVGTPGMHRQGDVFGGLLEEAWIHPHPAQWDLRDRFGDLICDVILTSSGASWRAWRDARPAAAGRCPTVEEAKAAALAAFMGRLAQQSAPVGGAGDCWAELLAHVGPSHPASAMAGERRLVGLARYGQPVRRGDGRDSARDLREELLDGAVYAWRQGHTVLAVHLLDLAPDPGRDGVVDRHARAWLRTAQESQAERDVARAERDSLRGRIAELEANSVAARSPESVAAAVAELRRLAASPEQRAFDAAVAAQERVAELEEDLSDARADLLDASADLAIVDQILAPICGPTIPDDRRVRLGVLLARAHMPLENQ